MEALLRERRVTGRNASLPAPLLSAFGILVVRGTVGAFLDYHIKCNTAPKKERHCVRFVLE